MGSLRTSLPAAFAGVNASATAASPSAASTPAPIGPKWTALRRRCSCRWPRGRPGRSPACPRRTAGRLGLCDQVAGRPGFRRSKIRTETGGSGGLALRGRSGRGAAGVGAKASRRQADQVALGRGFDPAERSVDVADDDLVHRRVGKEQDIRVDRHLYGDVGFAVNVFEDVGAGQLPQLTTDLAKLEPRRRPERDPLRRRNRQAAEEAAEFHQG